MSTTVMYSALRAVSRCAVAAIVVCFSAPSLLAGTILSSTTTPAAPPVVSGPGLGVATVPAIFTLNPNNDNSAGPGATDNNVLVPLKRFDFQDYIDIEFSVLSSGGVSEYVVTEFVDNNTGNNWTGYKMYLGTGTGANFTQIGLPAGLDFDTGPPGGNDLPPTSAAFSTVSRPDDVTLEFSGGSHGSGAQLYSFRIDVPDINLLQDLVGTFTLRQVPVPEPTTIALAGLALAGFAACRRRN